MIDCHCTRFLWRLLERHYGLRRKLERLEESVEKNSRYRPEAARSLAELLRQYLSVLDLVSMKDFEEEELLTCLKDPYRARVLLAKPHLSSAIKTLRLMAQALEKSSIALEEGSREAHQAALELAPEFARMLLHLIELQDEMVSDILEAMLRPESAEAIIVGVPAATPIAPVPQADATGDS
ncbi:MAG: hypothetical protein HY303_11100 [Candidatus Wallbacteria bacterium]|nr:hypothetical protein [Candidatus Wallbacteria bacterium]